MNLRPIQELADSLRDLGIKIEYLKASGFPPLRIISTKTKKSVVKVSGANSSQYLSAILLSATCYNHDTEIITTNKIISKSYVDTTINMIEDFGAHVEKTENGYFIKKGKYNNVKGYVMHINEPFLYKTEVLNSDIFFEFLNKTFATPIISVDNRITSSNRSLIELMYIEYEKENAVNLELIASLFQSFILSLRDIKLSNEKILLTKDFYNFTIFNELLEENFWSIRTVDKYAEMMSLSKKTINKAIRTVTGLSAKQYIIDRVILEIKRYLSQGNLMNYEIANLLNFDEAANMTKFFKKYVGISPKQFREEN